MRVSATRVSSTRTILIRSQYTRPRRYYPWRNKNTMNHNPLPGSSFLATNVNARSDLDSNTVMTSTNDTDHNTFASPPAALYPSLLLPWSSHPSEAELLYRDSDHVKTKGTIPLLPPQVSTLISTFNSPPRPNTRMSAGAVALCKHFERGVWNQYATRNVSVASEGSSQSSDASKLPSKPSAEHQILHPFWPLPTGSNENKTRIAAEVLDGMLRDAIWKNVMLLHAGVAVYEIRNSRGYGMRWTLQLEEWEAKCRSTEEGQKEEVGKKDREVIKEESRGQSIDDRNSENWTIKKVSFRGFLEPIGELDIEVLNRKDADVSGQCMVEGR